MLFGFATLGILQCQAEDIREIVRRGTAAIQSDWAADPEYAFVERDAVQKDQQISSKTSQVVTIAGSDYFMPLAVNDEPLPPERKKIELEKLKNEVLRRNSETPAARQHRIEKYKKQREENGALLLEFPNIFTFELVGEGTMNGHPAYILSATPHRRAEAVSRAAKVLSAMRGTVWIDKDTYHMIRADCHVFAPVPVFGPLARVLPGTHIRLQMSPVNEAIWLVDEFSMELTVSKMFLFKANQVTRSTYSDYRLNTVVLDQLLSAGQP